MPLQITLSIADNLPLPRQGRKRRWTVFPPRWIQQEPGMCSGVWWQIQNSWVRKSVRTRYGPWRRSNKYCEWHAGWWWHAMPGWWPERQKIWSKKGTVSISLRIIPLHAKCLLPTVGNCGNPICAKLKSKSEIIFPIWGISTFQTEALPVFKANQPDYGLFPIHGTICGVLHCTPSPRLQICLTIFWDL